MSEKILLVDDEKVIIDSARRYLEGKGYQVIFTDNGSEAVIMARESRPDLVVTDAEMAGLDGFALCRIIKETPELASTPVIIISGRKVQDEDIVEGYERGADDYVLKPVSLPVLLAKIKAVLKRYAAARGRGGKLENGNISIDPSARTVSVGGGPVRLTRKEFDLLALLVGEAGRILAVPYLLETVWGYDPASYNDPHTVGVHVSSLRKKLGAEAGARITSVTGHGYKFE
ncbi:MAG: two-component system OmpR family alkaline phosphatase synthesis response regulator PhoP [Elusimicrobia bacterium]|nr:MAG: two-component system OmpR family alkaline phosphatase synthesis response regulator PhoP [Elusimicrobiota bacterium]KAF0156835.1 MAG: two-component system OmpR family alkaline phosphatase synthesis response regulator PhoP [Elusimicrobiota bacterium]